MSELSRIMKNVFASPEVAEASRKQLQGILSDLHKADPSFPDKLSDSMLKDLHTYFFRHQFSTLKEEMPEKIRNWVLFHQNEYQKNKNEKNKEK